MPAPDPSTPPREDQGRAISPEEIRIRPRSAPPIEPTLPPEPIAATPTVIAGGACVEAESQPAGGRPFGRYVLQEELGHGGMGRVWKAWDTQLSRVVALKQILSERQDDERVERFMREARLAARLRHPNIVAVHDVGVVHEEPDDDGVHYFTSDYVQGRSLDSAAEGTSIRQVVEWVASVAEALAFAHAQGVIHRDIKPGNILVGGDGKAYVMDFGLAREVQEVSGLTLSGELMGTPSYMSPEQAEGRTHDIGPASDQFSLGVTLYQLLAGRLPFRAADLRALLNAVAEEDPPPPSRWNARLHRDLDVVCMRAMEKDANRRHATIGEFAAELRRFLAGEPVLARRSGWLDRSWRRARRYPLVSGLTAAVIVASVAVGVVTWRAAADRRASQDRQATAEAEARRLVREALSRLRELGRAQVDAALARRAAGDREGSLEYSNAIAGPVEQLKREAPWSAEPWYQEGRMLRALQRNDEAERALDRAIELARATGADEGSLRALPLALYERGVLRMQRHRGLRERRKSELLRARASELQEGELPPEEPTPEEVESIYPDVAQARGDATSDFAEALDGLGQGMDRLEAGARRGAAAMLAVLSRRQDAEELLRQALDADRYMVEVYAALADLALARDDRERAAGWYEEGHQADRGYVPHLEGCALAWNNAALQRESSGQDGSKQHARAVAAVDEALAWDASNPALYGIKAVIFMREGDARRQTGKDEKASYLACIEVAEEGIRRAGESATLVGLVGGGHHLLGNAAKDRAEDPEPEYRLALALYEKAQALDPEEPVMAINLGAACHGLGQACDARGEDPTEYLERALAYYQSALELDPRKAEVLRNRALVYSDLGERRCDRGEEPSEAFQEALSEYDRLLAVLPRYPVGISGRAKLWVEIGDELDARGQDAREAWETALRGFGEALSLNPSLVSAFHDRAVLHQRFANLERGRGGDPMPELERAAADLETAVRINPRYAHAHVMKSGVLVEIAALLREQGQDPTGPYERALDASAQAAALAPSNKDVIWQEALLHAVAGEVLQSRGEYGGTECEKAIAGFQRIQAYVEADPIRLNEYGKVFLVQARAIRARGGDATATFEAALSIFDRAIALRPHCAPAVFNRAMALWALGGEVRWRGESPLPRYREAVATLDALLDSAPGYSKAAYERALMCGELGAELWARGEDPLPSWGEALSAYERMLAKEPKHLKAAINTAMVLHSVTAWKAANGGDPLEEFERGVEAYGRAISLQPERWEFVHDLAYHWHCWGDWRRTRGESGEEQYARAVETYQRAIRLHPKSAMSAVNEAVVHRLLALSSQARGEDPRPELEASIARCDLALSIDPESWQAHANRGLALESLGRPAEAIEAYEAAIRIHGDAEPVLREGLPRARAAAAKAAEERRPPNR